MPHQPLAAVLAASPTDTGFHPGAAYFLLVAAIIGAVIGAPLYVVRQVRNRRRSR